MERKTIITGASYFFLFSSLFFIFMFWMGRRGGDAGWGRGDGEQIALVRIEGVIIDSEEITRILNDSRDNDQIKAILLRIDSPGGAVVPSQEIYDMVKKIRGEGKKKVVTSMGTIAASGGYYIAAASDFIMANPGTLTGSMGVIMEMANVEGLLNKIGVESVVIKSGVNKDVGSPFRKMTEKDRAILQYVLDDVHDQFIHAVAEGRSLKVDGEGGVRSLADGRIFTGRQAKELGLVDGLGNLEDAIQKTAEMAGISGKPRVVETRDRFSVFKMLKGTFLGSASYLPPLRLNYLLSF